MVESEVNLYLCSTSLTKDVNPPAFKGRSKGVLDQDI